MEANLNTSIGLSELMLIGIFVILLIAAISDNVNL
jgi:hypothetical protein